MFSAASKGREYVWKGRDGMRSLEVLIPVTLSKGKRKLGGEMVRMLIRPKEEEFAVDSFQKVLSGHTKGDEGDEGGVVAVRSTAIDISPGAKADKAPGVGMAERVFSIGSGNDQKRVRIWEETGESIARHIWYAMDPDRYVLSFIPQLTFTLGMLDYFSPHTSPLSQHLPQILPHIPKS